MGLDMYFTGKRYLWDFGDTPDKEIAVSISKHFPEIKDKRVKQVEVEFMYWRKANAIHKWFVDECQDGVDECQDSYVSLEKLHDLRNICKAVLADRSQAATLLPTQGGFFFGDTSYDDYYFQDVENTLKFLDQLLEDPDRYKNWDFYYHSSW